MVGESCATYGGQEAEHGEEPGRKGPGATLSSQGYTLGPTQTHPAVCFTHFLGISQANQVDSQD